MSQNIKAVLFDLDGTLLPMDQEEFTKAYFRLLAKKLSAYGYSPEKLVDTIWAGTTAMVKNDGTRTNEDAFWDQFAVFWGADVRKDEPIFDSYYREDFCGVKDVCGYHPAAAETVALCKALGLRVILATNPIFPAVATEARIRWAGLSREDFELYTTYENSHFCKPNPAYYEEILCRQGLFGEECIMVGNDVTEDMAAEALGMKVFLLTDCLINKHGKDISRYPRGSFGELQAFLREQVRKDNEQI